MSDVVIVAMIAAGASSFGVVVSVFGVIVSARNTRKIDVVHEAVNGGWTKMRDELREAEAVIATLTKEIQTLKKALL